MSRKSKSKKPKKDKPLYDEDGKWVDQDSRVLSGIRRAYRLSPQMQETLKAARVELPPEKLKTGKPGKRVRVRYKCAACGELFSSKNVQVDHISPATPMHTSIREMTWDEVVDGIFCGVDNLQVICSTPMIRNGGLPSCHAKKSAEENWIRKKLAVKKLEYENIECYCKFTGELASSYIKEYKEEYQQYLIEKEEKRLAKEERKRVRATKKLEKLQKAIEIEEKRRAKNG
jgi:ribosomal protein L44E